MEIIKLISQHFLLALAFGTGAFTFMADSKATGMGFVKLIHWVCGGALAVGLLIHLSQPSSPPGGNVALAYYGALLGTFLPFLFLEKNQSFLNGSFFTIKNLLLFYLACQMVEKTFFSVLFYLATIFYLGSVVYGMLLGHWYLVVPKLSEKPLLKTMKVTWFTMALKGILSFWGLQMGLDLLWGEMGMVPGTSFQWLMVIMRFLWGYLALFVLSVFTWKLIKMRSLQSATGTLYIMVFFLLVGEIISAFFIYNYGLLI